MKRITGRLTEKNGKWYAVINLYTVEGKRKEKWQGLDLEAKKGSKTEAGHRLNELLSKYNSGDLYLKESLTHAEQERMRLADQKVDEYIVEWLESHKCNISVLTYNSYKRMTDGRIVPYFKKLGIPLKELTGDEINAFYLSLRNDGLTGATAQRYHSMMHLAFKQAVKRRVIPTNPCDQADRPKAVQYIGTYYNSAEIKQLLECLDGDPMAGHYDPTGTTTTTYAYPSSECDRKINVSYYDTSGNFLKKVVIHTKKGMEASFHIGLGGYDITKFESNQGLWETCKMSWTSGTGTCTEADLFVVYYFRTGLSKSELNITVTMRKWDKIEFEVRHYVEQNPNYSNFHRDNYSLHSTTNKTSLNYYDSISVGKKTITGYTISAG